MKYTTDEERIIKIVFQTFYTDLTSEETQELFGACFSKKVSELAGKIYWADYCKEHNLKYEDMTDDDFEDAYFEMLGI